MKSIHTLAGTLAYVVIAHWAYADAGHDGSFAFGSPGKEAEVVRTVQVEASDKMRFDPSNIEVRQGDTIKFVVTNIGKVKHEFAIGDRASQRAHALMMKKMPNMKHDDDAATISLDPGQTRTIVWRFDKTPASPIEIACHEPGHYEAGMKMQVVRAK